MEGTQRKLTKERIKLKYRKYVEVVKGGKNDDDLVKCHIFFLQSGGTSLWRVCYQQGPTPSKLDHLLVGL